MTLYGNVLMIYVVAVQAGHTRYMSSAGVRITFYQDGTTIKATVRDIKPNE